MPAARGPTLGHYVHDLHAICEHYDTAEVTVLTREIMLSEAEMYGDRFPAYRDDPLEKTLYAARKQNTWGGVRELDIERILGPTRRKTSKDLRYDRHLRVLVMHWSRRENSPR